jgi:hypothetical protein
MYFGVDQVLLHQKIQNRQWSTIYIGNAVVLSYTFPIFKLFLILDWDFLIYSDSSLQIFYISRIFVAKFGEILSLSASGESRFSNFKEKTRKGVKSL